MNAPVSSATEIYSRMLEVLGRGDGSDAVRSLQSATVELCTHIDESGANWKSDDDSDWLQESLDLCAAHIAPLAADAKPQMHHAVTASLQFIAGESERERMERSAAARFRLALHHLGWFAATVGLANDRLEIVCAVARVPVAVNGKATGNRLFDAVELRFLEIESGNALKGFDAFNRWIQRLPFRSALPMLRRDSDAMQFVGETDLIASLYFAGHRDRVPCPSVNAGSGRNASARLNFHLANDRSRLHLAELFSTTPTELDALVNARYQRLIGADGLEPHGQLIPVFT